MNKNTVTKEKILASAKYLIEKQGFESTTIMDISKNAGLKHTSVYYYFKNKDQIATCIQTQYFEEIFRETARQECEFKNKMTFLIQYTYNIHKKILGNKVMKTLFFEKTTYKNPELNHLARIVDLCISVVKTFMKSDALDITFDDMLVALLAWEGSAKNLFFYIRNSDIKLTIEESIMLLTKNLYVDLGFNYEEINNAIDEFKEIVLSDKINI